MTLHIMKDTDPLHQWISRTEIYDRPPEEGGTVIWFLEGDWTDEEISLVVATLTPFWPAYHPGYQFSQWYLWKKQTGINSDTTTYTISSYIRVNSDYVRGLHYDNDLPALLAGWTIMMQNGYGPVPVERLTEKKEDIGRP